MAFYKYLSPDRIDLLRNSHIRFTQPASFNDPFEAFPYFKQIAPDEHIDAHLKEAGWDESEIEEFLKESWSKQLRQNPNINIPFDFVRNKMMSMMNQSRPFMNQFFKNFMGMKNPFSRKLAIDALLGAMNKEIGILSLTEKNDNLLMWSHYALNHTGFVIEFDEDHPFFDQRSNKKEIRKHLRKVRYSHKRPEVTLFNPSLTKDENMDNWVNNIFWVKSIHWEYEQEWRMIYTLRDCQRIVPSKPYDIYLFPFPKESIKTVYLGCKMQPDISDGIQNLLATDKDYSHVKINRAVINEKEYRLNFINV